MAHSHIIFHVPADWLTDDRAGLLPFYRRLDTGLTERGVSHEFVPMDRGRLADQVGDGHIHILNHARFPHPNVFSAGIAYVYPFWHLDPQGIRAFSSIRDMVFRPGRVENAAAQAFFRRLRARMLDKRLSRYEQPTDVEDVPRECIAIFLQSEGHRIVGETLWLDRWTMVETCLKAAQGRPVVIKPHPRDLDTATFDRLGALQNDNPNLHISFANIHDILAVAARVVTINSAVGIEAYLHRKPVILCGQTDFHHIADEARTPEALSALLSQAPSARRYAKYLHWYFAQNCLNAGSLDLTDRFLARISGKGPKPAP